MKTHENNIDIHILWCVRK